MQCIFIHADPVNDSHKGCVLRKKLKVYSSKVIFTATVTVTTNISSKRCVKIVTTTYLCEDR